MLPAAIRAEGWARHIEPRLRITVEQGVLKRSGQGAGTLLSTGTEDYFDSAFGFDTGRIHGPVSGCTHRKGGMPGPLGHSGDPKCFTNGTAMEVSAYRFHEEDPLAFTEGVKVVWRISDILNYDRPSPKCFIETVNASAGDQSLGGAATVVTSYVWVYTW